MPSVGTEGNNVLTSYKYCWRDSRCKMMEKCLRYSINIIIIGYLAYLRRFPRLSGAWKELCKLDEVLLFLSLISHLVVQHNLLFFDCESSRGSSNLGCFMDSFDKNKFSYETIGVRNNLSPQISLKMYVKCGKISTIWLIIFVKSSSQGDFLSTLGSLQTMKADFTKRTLEW